VGVLVGLEIPLVMRILKRQFRERYALKDLVSQVLTFDYLGALAVALAFPLLFVPHLGLVRTGVFFGLLNAAVAVWALWLFRAELRRWRLHAAACAAVVAALVAAMAGADHITTWAEDRFYGDNVVLRESSDYQRVVVTSGRPACACSSTATCSSTRATNTATTRPWCTPPWPRTARRGACWCWAAATAWRCARCCATPRCSRSRWSSWTRT
jgi:uncharacterized membrane protein YvlD (DUF360 family)